MTETTTHCTILGGGIAGLAAANALQSQGVAVSVVDKGQGIGGRLASRRLRWDPDPQVLGVADYGALQFRVTDPRFQHQVDRWVEQGLLRLDPSSAPNAEQGQLGHLYSGTSSLRTFTQRISQDLSLYLKTRVTQIHWQATTQTWELTALNPTGTAVPLLLHPTHLIVTCPVPQTLVLLQESAIPLTPEQHHNLHNVRYHPCLTVLLLLANPSQIPATGLRKAELPPELSTLRCHYHSGISPQGYAVTLQASPTFSEQHWEAEDSWIINQLITLAQPWLGSSVLTQHLHRWRYSQPAQYYLCSDRPHLALQPNLILAGDAFTTQQQEIDPSLSVQQAFLSGLSAAAAITEI
ncbi:MAG: NAD(P)/FAD-dependent oxidoreductase [Prochlorotrichaceae cyanobacterium]